MTKKTNNLVASGVLALVAACGGSQGSTPTDPSGQVVGGTAALSTFPGAVSSARVMQASKMISEARVARDGTFALNIPTGKGYRIEFVNGERSAGLVFPRQTGVVEHNFDIVTGGASFDLGTVRYVGDPAGQQFRFGTSGSAGAAQKKGGEQSDGDGECEDGIDALTGAICVDDEDDEGFGACAGADGEENDGEENDDEEDDGEENDEESGVDCVDGIDAATGAECDGGPGANQDDGEEDDDGEENDDEENDGEENDDQSTPAEAAVADHNLPGAVCASDADDDDENGKDHEDDEDDEVDCVDGIDSKTGAECDGGPGADQNDGESQD